MLMDARILNLKTPDQCEAFARNATERNRAGDCASGGIPKMFRSQPFCLKLAGNFRN